MDLILGLYDLGCRNPDDQQMTTKFCISLQANLVIVLTFPA